MHARPTDPVATPAPGRRPSAGPARSPAPGRVRLTRRGRVVVVLAALLAASGLLSAGHATLASTQDAPHDRVVVVRPGETLWEIAARSRPNEDPRPFVHEVVELNGLASAGLDAGQRLRLPSR